MMRHYLLLLFCSMSVLSLAQETFIVQLEEKVELRDFLKSQAAYDLKLERILFSAINLYEFSASSKVRAAQLVQHPMVQEMQFNTFIEERTTLPNDPDFAKQWALQRIDAPSAWDITTGGETINGDRIVVAILETGFEIEHPDLRDNIWQNPYEIPDNGIDDDQNGFVDDVNGWNFRGNTNFDPNHAISTDTLGQNTFDRGAHGQQVTGIVGGGGDTGQGGVGINWQIDMMPLQYRSVADIFAAYGYVYEMRRRYNMTNGRAGAFVVVTNASWGLTGIVPCAIESAWNDCYEKLGEVGILTAAGVKNLSIDIDLEGDTPSGCPSDYLISVMNTDEADQKASDSAFGRTTVDIAAPGKSIFTTSVFDTYTGGFQGSSAATPHVSGAVALLYSMVCEELATEALSDPSATALQIKKAILDGADRVSALQDLNMTAGRLNLFKSMLEIQQQCDPMPGEQLKIHSLAPNPVDAELNVIYEADGLSEVEFRVYDVLGRLLQVVERMPCCQQVNAVRLQVATYPAGTYFLELVQGDVQTSACFVKY
ncbi:MAG: S8 family peptidase [Bacteroidota bacterium]